MKRDKLFPYLIYFLLGVFFNLGGVALISMSKKFNTEIDKVAYTFMMFTLFNTLAVFINGYLLDKVKIQRLIQFSFVVCFIGILGITNSTSLFILSTANAFFGFGSGLLFSTSNFIAINHYPADQRSSKLAMINFMYSFGAVLAPIVTGYFIKMGLKWEYAYNFNAVYVAVLFLLCIGIDFRRGFIEIDDHAKNESKKEKWPLSIYLSSISMIAYVMSEIIFSYWIVSYLNVEKGVDIAVAGVVLSVFWGFIALGRLSSSFLVRILKNEKYILIFSSIGFISYFLIMNTTSIYLIFIEAALMGFGYSGLYPTILSFGTSKTKVPSSKVMTFLISGGGIGAIMAMPVSARIKQISTIGSAVYFGTFLIGCVLFFNILSLISDKRKKLSVK